MSTKRTAAPDAPALLASAVDALRPFAKSLDHLFEYLPSGDRHVIRGCGPDLAITFGDLRRALRLVQEFDAANGKASNGSEEKSGG